MASTLDRITRALRGLARVTTRDPGAAGAPPEGNRGVPSTRRGASAPEAGPAAYGPYLGDATTLPDTTYAPHPDGDPDPGEIVWSWVPFEEDHTRGKDRPVLVIGHDGRHLVGLQLTSQDHDRDEHQERRAGREWVDIGTGPWDRRGRPSEVRVNRLLRLDPGMVRREGAVLPRERYEDVVAAVRTHY
ncbi:type II toxin-antitoxin system PemK/MazF family toxin [Intrasporangium sp.]|uniref:type II toxin-antitoxin system PemK/MazF family toxin n=1 Tax=Intrasporangium sp. TaxID=1925024 RepID=UPI00293B69ED|nr:type II toxin-antitoxin system PemK/MazF family toxin [Intrasporangium sp.]MDV3223099.1 type II toxin-antitoxin system PemK/MazF family toxin [Intrasporangium sp.]